MTLTRNVLILGGGVAGMAAAKQLALSGILVHVVEKKAHLGGKVVQWACMATDQCQNCGACLGDELVQSIHQFRNITIYHQSELSKINRTQNGFSVTISGKNSSELEVNAVLAATGFELFDPTNFQALGYGQHSNVITTAELNTALQTETLSEFIPDQPDPAIAFVQCVGSRNREIGRDYCSQVCCKTALRQANKLHHRIPDAQISVFYMDLQVIGKEFRTQYARLADQIRLLQGVPAEILTGYKENKLTVIREDGETGTRKAHHFDLIVLSVGMGPSKGTTDFIKMMGIAADEWGFRSRPNHTEHKGIYFAGTVQTPMDILHAIEQGMTAANQILHDFKTTHRPTKLAVLGQNTESYLVAKALAADNYNVMMIESEKNDHDPPKNIQIFSNSALTGIQGTFGNFEIAFKTKNEIQSINVDAVVVANGVDRSLPLDSIHAEPNSKIMALSDFNRNVQADLASIPSTIIFWLDHFGPEWKENCGRVLALAKQLADAQKSVTILMDKMLVTGLLGQRNYDEARRKGVKFLRIASNNYPSIKKIDDHLTVTLKEATLPKVTLELQCDCLVIPEKITPRADNTRISYNLAIDCDEEGFLQPANVRHRPCGSPRKGIFFVGSCHDETDSLDLEQEVAAVRAALDLLAKGYLEDDNLPKIKEGHCVKCLTCLRICPHGAITLEAYRQPTIAPQACFACGFCVASCPAEAIAFEKRPRPKNTDAPAPHTVVFACRRSGALAAAKAYQMELCHQDHIDVITVSCASRLNLQMLLEPLSKGSHRVMIAACHAGNCQSKIGPQSAVDNMSRIFSEINLPDQMLSFHSIAANEPAIFAKIVTNDSPNSLRDPSDQ
jgi:heterodisulfide reductase subunit A-like polyferredoxin/coenzyme F420-reducing hydrogenase delta subunit